MATAAEVQAKIDKLATNMDRFNRITNGGVNEYINTDNHTVPSIPNFFETIGDADQIKLDAQAAASAADVSATQAALAADAAGRPVYASVAEGLAATVDGDKFRVQTLPGMQYYRNDAGSETFLGWLGEVLFNDVATLNAYTGSFADNTIIRTRKGAHVYVAVSTGQNFTTTGGNKLKVNLGPSGRAMVEAFGCVFDGTTDSTAALKMAASSGLRLGDMGGDGQLIVKDTIPVPFGFDYEGAGRAVNNAFAKSNWRFEPPTKRDLFVWATAPTGYVFERTKIKGFAVRGEGAGGDAVFNLPNCYQPEFDVDAYTGFDHLARIDRWLDGEVGGSITAPRVSGVEWINSLGTASGVTTATRVTAYIAQGTVPAHTMAVGAVLGAVLDGPCESLSSVVVAAVGNTFTLGTNFYLENVPRTNTGYAFEIGKTGTAGAGVLTGMVSYAQKLSGLNGATDADWNNVGLLDLGDCDYVFLNNPDIRRFGWLVGFTENSKNIHFSGGRSLGVGWLTAPSISRDYKEFSFAGFNPVGMFLRGDANASKFDLAGAGLELFPVNPDSITRRKVAVDITNKLRRRDEKGNLTAPIGSLETAAYSGWTFNGARLVPGEHVAHSSTGLGEVAMWRSQRHTKDAGNNYLNVITTNGSPTISRSGGASFFPTEIGDYVTVSTGFGSATTQHRVLDRAADYTTLTLDTNASSSTTGATAATEAHQLVPISQQGHRSAGASPAGSVTPYFVGEEYLNTATANWFKSTGLTSSDWKQVT